MLVNFRAYLVLVIARVSENKFALSIFRVSLETPFKSTRVKESRLYIDTICQETICRNRANRNATLVYRTVGAFCIAAVNSDELRDFISGLPFTNVHLHLTHVYKERKHISHCHQLGSFINALA